jgi:hypothetical protein
VELSDLNQSEQEQHAFFLGLAALLGEGVYNLGELVSRKENDIENNCNLQIEDMYPSHQSVE